MATPAKVQEVRYDVPQPSDFQRFMEGALSIGGGMILGKQQRERQKQEDMLKLFPYFVQMKMAKPGGSPGQPGVMDVPGLGSYSITAPAPDQQELYYQAKIDELRREMGDMPLQPAQAYRMAVNEVSKQINNDVAWQMQLKDKDPNVRMQAERRRDDEISRLSQAYMFANGATGEHEYPVRKKGSTEPYGTATIDQIGSDPNDEGKLEYQDVDGTWKDAFTKKAANQSGTGPSWINAFTIPAGIKGAELGIKALGKVGEKALAQQIPLHPSKEVQAGIDALSKTGLGKKALAGVSRFAPWASKAVPAAWAFGAPFTAAFGAGMFGADAMMANPATQNFDINKTAAAPLAWTFPPAALLGNPEGRAALAHPLGYMFNSQYRNNPLGYQGYQQ